MKKLVMFILLISAINCKINAQNLLDNIPALLIILPGFDID